MQITPPTYALAGSLPAYRAFAQCWQRRCKQRAVLQPDPLSELQALSNRELADLGIQPQRNTTHCGRSGVQILTYAEGRANRK